MVGLDQLLEPASIDHAARVFESFFLDLYDSEILLGSPEFRSRVERSLIEIIDGVAE